MFKNSLPISTLLGILILGIGTICLAYCADTIPDDISYEGHVRGDTILLLVCTFLGILVGIGFILKIHWVRHIFAFLLIVTFLFFVFLMINEPPNGIYPMVGASALLISVFLFFILLLYNKKVSEEFGDKHAEKDLEDIIDFYE